MVGFTSWINGGFIELIYSSMAGSVLFDLALLHLNTPLSLINTAEPEHAIWDVMGLAVSGIQRYALTLGTSAESLHRWERPGNLFGNPTADCEALYEDWLIAYGRVFSPHRPTALDRPDWIPRSPREIQDIMLAANCMMAPKLPPIPLVQMLVHKPGTLENPGSRADGHAARQTASLRCGPEGGTTAGDPSNVIVPTATTSNIWAILPSIPLDTNGQPVATLSPTDQTTQIVFQRRGNLQTTFRLEVPDFVRIFRPDGSPFSNPEADPTLSDPYTVLHFVSGTDRSSAPPSEPPLITAPATANAAPQSATAAMDTRIRIQYSFCNGIQIGYQFNASASPPPLKLLPVDLSPRIDLAWHLVPGSGELQREANQNNGFRFYTDSSPSQNLDSPELLELRVFTSRVFAGKTIFLKSFDIDDTTPSQHDHNDIIDSNGMAGSDNVCISNQSGSSCEPYPGLFNNNSDTISVQVNAHGQALINSHLPLLFKASRNPGDNFRVAATFQQSTLTALQVDNPNMPNHISATSRSVDRVFLSAPLTVWRRLWIEIDSMEKGTEPANLRG